MKRIISTLLLSGTLLTTLANVTLAQGLPGLTLFGGVEARDQLRYRLDFGGNADGWDRYRLRVPGGKLNYSVTHFIVSYPDYYKGKFNPKKVEVTQNKKSLPLAGVKWEKEKRQIVIELKNPLPSGKTVELVLDDVKNPAFGGMFYFDCQVKTLTGNPDRPDYIGTWILSIN